jgi:DNA-binding MarR family transcriptional regulator
MQGEKKMPIMQAIGMAYLRWTRHCQKEMLLHGITLKQFEVLRQLEKKTVLYPAEIADMLFCDRPTATVVIKNMERQGWVKRELDPDDFRRIKVTLESAGRAKLEEIAWEPPNSRNKKFHPVSCFTGQEREQLSHLLAKLNHHLGQLKEEI